MGNTERTFGDRLARAKTMQAAIAGFVPAFSPADATLSPAGFLATLNGIEALNNAIAAGEAARASAIASRASLLTAIKDRAGQVGNFVKSNSAWKVYLPAVKQAADAVRGYRAKSEPEPVAEGVKAAPKRKLGQQSYGDVDVLFEKLVEAVKLIPGYAPAASSNIQVNQLAALLTSYRAATQDLATKSVALSASKKERVAAYDDELTGLRAKMKSIKDAAKGLYGMGSAEFGAIKSISV